MGISIEQSTRQLTTKQPARAGDEAMKVSYDKEMKDKAKAEDKSLFTLAVTWPGGKPAMLAQGYATDAMVKEIYKFFTKMQKMGKADREKNPT